MNNKLTTPKSILIGSLIIAGSILYTNGFNFSIVPEVKADYHWADSSHDHYEYADDSHDHDEFYDILSKSRVISIIEDCDVVGESISC